MCPYKLRTSRLTLAPAIIISSVVIISTPSPPRHEDVSTQPELGEEYASTQTNSTIRDLQRSHTCQSRSTNLRPYTRETWHPKLYPSSFATLEEACQTDLQAEDVPLLQPHVRSRAIPSSDSGDFGHELAPKLVGMELRYTLPADDDRLMKSSTRLLLVAGGVQPARKPPPGGRMGQPRAAAKTRKTRAQSSSLHAQTSDPETSVPFKSHIQDSVQSHP